MRLFHGTRRQFSEFLPEFIEEAEEPGFFFFEHETNCREYAGDDGYILEVEVTASKVLDQTSLMWHRGEGMSPAAAFATGYNAVRVTEFE